MECSTYYGNTYDDEIKPVRGVVYYMLEQYMKDKVDKEIDRLVTSIEKKIEYISVNSITAIKDMKNDILKVKERIDRLARTKVDRPDLAKEEKKKDKTVKGKDSKNAKKEETILAEEEIDFEDDIDDCDDHINDH